MDRFVLAKALRKDPCDGMLSTPYHFLQGGLWRPYANPPGDHRTFKCPPNQIPDSEVSSSSSMVFGIMPLFLPRPCSLLIQSSISSLIGGGLFFASTLSRMSSPKGSFLALLSSLSIRYDSQVLPRGFSSGWSSPRRVVKNFEAP